MLISNSKKHYKETIQKSYRPKHLTTVKKVETLIFFRHFSANFFV
jgi:hypothetical protein